MSAQDTQPSPLDLVASWWQTAGAVTASIVSRNTELWAIPASGKAYDPKRVMEVVTDDVRDVWALWMGLLPNQRVAFPVPLVYVDLSFEVSAAGTTLWTLSDPTWIPAPLAGLEGLPETATIELSGRDDASASALKAAMQATLCPGGLAYLLELSAPMSPVHGGAYAGVVHAGAPDLRPIAELRVIVTGPAPVSADDAQLIEFLYGPDSGWIPSSAALTQTTAASLAQLQLAFTGDDAKALSQCFEITHAIEPDAPYLLTAVNGPYAPPGTYYGSVFVNEPPYDVLALVAVVIV